MADINLNSAVIDAAVEELRQAKMIIDLQCNTLREVEQIIETSFQCSDTARLKSCVSSTYIGLGRCGGEFRDIARSLQFSVEKAKITDTLKGSGNHF